MNPYESPRCLEQQEQTVTELMNAVRTEYEGRFRQLAMDAVLAAEMAATFGMVAWRISEDPLYAGVSAVAPIVFFAVESTRDFVRVIQEFPGRMQELRARSCREWSAAGMNGSGVPEVFDEQF